MSQYDLNRNAQSLEPHFTKHMSAMTSEGLHSKSDIACELAYRDCEITRLREQLADADKVIYADDILSAASNFAMYRKKWGKDA